MLTRIGSSAHYWNLAGTALARRRLPWVLRAVLILALSVGHVSAPSAASGADGVAGKWVGTWKSALTPAGGSFSAVLSAKPAWWGDVEILGTLKFAGMACARVLSVSGSYFRGDEYLLTAKDAGGAIRVTSAVTVTSRPRRSLSGHYEVVPGGTGCRSDSGRVDATAQ